MSGITHHPYIFFISYSYKLMTPEEEVVVAPAVEEEVTEEVAVEEAPVEEAAEEAVAE